MFALLEELRKEQSDVEASIVQLQAGHGQVRQNKSKKADIRENRILNIVQRYQEYKDNNDIPRTSVPSVTTLFLELALPFMLINTCTIQLPVSNILTMYWPSIDQQCLMDLLTDRPIHNVRVVYGPIAK